MESEVELARYALTCSETHMEDVNASDRSLTLATRAHAHATLAVAEAISELTGVIADRFSE